MLIEAERQTHPIDDNREGGRGVEAAERVCPSRRVRLEELHVLRRQGLGPALRWLAELGPVEPDRAPLLVLVGLVLGREAAVVIALVDRARSANVRGGVAI